MGIFDFLKPKSTDQSSAANPLAKRLEQIASTIEELEKKYPNHHHFYSYHENVVETDVFIQPSEIKGVDDLVFLSSLIPALAIEKTLKSQWKKRVIIKLFDDYALSNAVFTDEELYPFIQNCMLCKNYGYSGSSENKLFTIVKQKIKENGVTEILRKTLLLFITPDDEYMYLEHKKRNQAIQYLLQEPSPVPVNQHDQWGEKVIRFLESVSVEEKKQNWIDLFIHCLDAGDKALPPKNWLEKSGNILDQIGHEEFSGALIEWLSFNAQLIQAIHKNEQKDYLRDVNHSILKNLIWCAGIVNQIPLTIAIDKYASMAYKKKPGKGALSLKTGNACMYAFTLLPFKEAVTRLMKFRNQTTNNTILKSIDKMIGEVARKHGYTKDLIAEIGVMNFGLDKNGYKEIAFENISCKVEIKTGEVIVAWYKDGRNINSVPALIRTNYAIELKELKSEIKDLSAQLQVQKDRIENYYLCKKRWKYKEWFENYFEHPVVRTVAGRLIWTLKQNNKTVTAFYQDDAFVNSTGEKCEIDIEKTEVELWHPIFSTIEEVVSWRNFIQRYEIVQPFKQAYREVYILTDAEINTGTYSNRFAAHVLRQHQFAALCKQRSWKYTLMGNWDSHNTPVIQISHWDMLAQYYVDTDSQGITNEPGIFLYITTDQVRFYEKGELMQLTIVPRLVFSEVMRDVDLFVGVSSIGNDTAWADGGEGAHTIYWREYSFGDLSESSKIRGEVLQRLIPRLKIRDQCSFHGKFLIVKGKIRTYKIHMGSGNILMEPNDQYLCIVPERKLKNEPPKVFLPFEGDTLLSIIISKALLLAEDDKIKDEIIIKQLESKKE